MAIIMYGKEAAAQIKAEVKARIQEIGASPGLAVVIAGDDPASRAYMNGKKKDCADCGMKSHEFALAADAGQEELLALLQELNRRPDIHGILLHLPLPPGFCEKTAINAIVHEKDVDNFLPCTPAGVIELLDFYGIDPAGKHCVVVGRSDIVGKPLAMMLLHRNATVTICHSRTRDLAAMTRQAAILVAAAGRPNLITADMVKPGAVVVDVAINRDTDGKLCGDVDYEAVKGVASHITPVPGGVGPMTRAILMRNTIMAAARYTYRRAELISDL